jgi:hypothetical protein
MSQYIDAAALPLAVAPLTHPAPYQVIHVGAAAPHIPQELIDQLDSPGRMFIPVGVGHQGESRPRPHGLFIRFVDSPYRVGAARLHASRSEPLGCSSLG